MQKCIIDVIVVGKLKEKSLKDLESEYTKRLTRYAKINIIELKDSKDNDINLAIKQELKLILDKIDEKSYIILLDIQGKMLSSEDLSKEINNITQTSGKITFIVGGSNGVSDDVKNKANMLLSFSPMTFPHQLFRIMLLEQIYRSLAILNNSPYHK